LDESLFIYILSANHTALTFIPYYAAECLTNDVLYCSLLCCVICVASGLNAVNKLIKRVVMGSWSRWEGRGKARASNCSWSFNEDMGVELPRTSRM